MKAQTLGDPNTMNYMMSKKSLELNPSHIIVKTIRDKINSNDNNETSVVKNLLHLLYDNAILDAGFTLEEPKTFCDRLNSMIMMGLGIDISETETETETENSTNISSNNCCNNDSCLNSNNDNDNNTEILDESMEEVD